MLYWKELAVIYLLDKDLGTRGYFGDFTLAGAEGTRLT